MLKIYHNPRCKISRAGLMIIQEKGAEVEIVDYLNNPPSVKEMKNLLKKLDFKPQEILRKQEGVFKKNFKGKDFSDEEWVKILIENPKLIERPIVVKGDNAVLGRPPENILELL